MDNELTLERYVFAVVERALRIQDYIDKYDCRWDIDLEIGKLVFSDKSSGTQLLTSNVQLIGTESLVTNTFLWAWTRDDVPSNLTKSAEYVRRLGEELGEDFFTIGDPIEIANPSVCWDISIVTVGASGAFMWYICPYESGRLYVAVEGFPKYKLPERDASIVSKTVACAIEMLDFDHRPAFGYYLGEPTIDEPRHSVWEFGETSFDVEFNEDNQVSKYTTNGKLRKHNFN
jgi:hypothetical protein